MKKNIKREKYENAIARIDFIYREKELLECMSRNKIYNAHIDLPGTFGELLINIIRENKKINNLINELENSFLQSFKKDKRLYKSLKNEFDEFWNANVLKNELENPASTYIVAIDEQNNIVRLCRYMAANR